MKELTNENGVYGIETLKLAVKTGFELGKGIKVRMADGKFSFVEAVTLLPKLKNIPYLVTHSKDIADQIKDLKTGEMRSLSVYVGEFVQGANAKLIIEKSMNVLIAIKELTESF